jgi:hypothetical protein
MNGIRDHGSPVLPSLLRMVTSNFDRRFRLPFLRSQGTSRFIRRAYLGLLERDLGLMRFLQGEDLVCLEGGISLHLSQAVSFGKRVDISLSAGSAVDASSRLKIISGDLVDSSFLIVVYIKGLPHEGIQSETPSLRSSLTHLAAI